MQARACLLTLFPDRRIDGQYRFPADTSNTIGCCGAAARPEADVREHAPASVAPVLFCQPANPPGCHTQCITILLDPSRFLNRLTSGHPAHLDPAAELLQF
jgi:hypothetical protein